MFNLTDLMTILLPKDDRKHLCRNYNIGMMLECEKKVFLWLQSVHKKITTENAPSTHLVDLLTCFMPQHQYFSHITAVS